MRYVVWFVLITLAIVVGQTLANIVCCLIYY